MTYYYNGYNFNILLHCVYESVDDGSVPYIIYPKTGDRKFKQVKDVSLVNRMQGLIVLDGHILTRKCRI